MRHNLTIWIFLASSLLTNAFLTHAQTKTWSPPDKSFTIKVPAELVKDKDGPGEASDPNAVTTFVGRSGENTFLVMVLKYPESRNKNLKDKFPAWWSMIGGDDDFEFTESDAKVGPLRARMVIFKNQPHKGMLVNGRDAVYLLGFFAKSKKDLDSATARSFFESFKLTPAAQ